MKSLKSVLILFTICASIDAHAQIRLKGYKCKFYRDQEPNTMAEMYNSNDTFLFTLYGRDIMGEIQDDDPGKELQLGLKLCFGGEHYTMTTDSFYIYTAKSRYANIYYYEVYDPNHEASITVRSKNNDSVFSQKSKWLLAQIRLHRNGDIFLLNEKGQSCQDPNNH